MHQPYPHLPAKMADLPGVRVTQVLPFVNTGCVYAGPIFLKGLKVGKPRIRKGYICLFVCMVTSAIHLELPCGASYTYVASLARYSVTTEQTSLKLSDPSTKCKNCLHLINIRTSSHPLWRMMEFSVYSILRKLLVGEEYGSRQLPVSNCISAESPPTHPPTS